MHTLWYLWIAYFWPSLKGNGPEALVQTLVYAAIAIVLYPPLRDWITHEAHSGEKLLHDKLDHIIKHHPDVPPFVPPAPRSGSVEA